MRRNFIRFLFSFLVLLIAGACIAKEKTQPNVIIIITDDQGYGDLGFTGNPHVKTPAIDAFAKESIRFNQFYVSPVCAPTRASLMTGRYSLRTGITDTYNGGAIMAPEEITIAEMLKNAGYKTGLFGKWHLGDNYPSRPNDQGFDESLYHLAGGMGQVGDFTTYFKRDSSYFDPVLWLNGKQETYQGYCSDIFADNALKFIEKNKESPFFCYLSFNAPHTPLQVPDKYYQIYKNIDPSTGFEDDDRPFVNMSKKDKEDARKVYAMVTNIDDNLKKLFAKLDELKIADNTIVIFMTDNGPQQIRYIAGMRGRKGNVYRGGVRVPFFMRYPKLTKKDIDIETTAAHIDILPTLAELCNANLPNDRIIDGKNMLPAIKGKDVNWEDRPLFFYWTRKYPELYNNIALQKGKYRLIGKTDYNAPINNFELFNFNEDPYEQNNLVEKEKEVAIKLKNVLDNHYQELIQSENLINSPLIIIGSQHENPIVLNRNDASGERGIWNQQEVYGKWKVHIKQGIYNVKFKFIEPVKANGRMFLETSPIINQMVNNTKNTDIIEMKNVQLPEMKGDLLSYYMIGRKNIFPFWVELEKID